MVTLAPCGTAITINASDSISYLNNVISTSSGFNAPDITQFNTLRATTGLTAVSNGGQLLGTTGKLYVQVPLALFVGTSTSLISFIDSEIAKFQPKLPQITTSIQGTYITLQNVPDSVLAGSSSLQTAAYTFGPFNTRTYLQSGSNFTNDGTSGLYAIDGLGPSAFICVSPQTSFLGPGLVLSDTKSTKRFFTSNNDLIHQINDVYIKSIFDTFQFRYTGVAGTGTAYLTSKGSDLIVLTGSLQLDFPDFSGVSYQNDVVAFSGVGTPTFSGINYLSIFDGLKGLEARLRGGPAVIQRSFSTTPGTVIVGDNTIFYTTFKPLIDHISGDTNLAMVVSGTRVNVTRGNVVYVSTTTGSSYSIPSNAQIMYTVNTLQVPTFGLSGIEKLTTLQGGSLVTYYLPSSIISIFGPGLLLYGTDAAFYTTDQTLQNQFSRSVLNVLSGSLGFAYNAPTGTTNLISSSGATTLLSLSNNMAPSPSYVSPQAKTVIYADNTVSFSSGETIQGVTGGFSFLDGPNAAVTIATPGITYSIFGDGTLYRDGPNAFYSTSGQLDSFLSPPYTVSQTLQGTSLTVARGATPLITSSTVYSVLGGTSLSYSGNTITVTDNASNMVLFERSPISSLTTVSTQQLLTSQSSLLGSLPSPGFLVYDLPTGNAFYTSDPTQISNIQSTYTQMLTNTFGLSYITTSSGKTATVLTTKGGTSLLQTTGTSSLPVDINAVQAVYQGDTLSLVGADGAIVGALPGISSFSYFSGPGGVVTLNVPGVGQVVPVQGGQVFYNQGKAFYTPSQQVIAYIDSIPAISYTVNGNQLEVTNGNAPVGMFSQLYTVPMGGRLGYSSDNVITITAPMGMGTTTTTTLSGSYPSLTSYDGAKFTSFQAQTTLQGPGQLYYNQGQGQAHYLTNPSLISTLNYLSQTVYRNTFTFGYSSVRGTTQTTLYGTPTTGGKVQSLVQLKSASATPSVPSSANSLTFQNNTVTFSGPDPATTYPTFPATSLFVFNNTLSSYKQQSSPITILGGGSVYTDGTSVFYTAHQQLNGYLALGMTSAPPPSLTFFKVIRDPDTGTASLLADGLNVLTLTGAASHMVPYGEYLTYTGGTVTVRSSSDQVLLNVPNNQAQLTVTDTNGVKTTVYEGGFPSSLHRLLVSTVMGGKVYFYGPQTFFTTYSAVIDMVDRALQNPTTPSFRIVIKNEAGTVNGGTAQNGVVTLTAGPNQKTIFPLSGAEIVLVREGIAKVLYINNTATAITNWTVLTANPTYMGNTITYENGLTISSPGTPTIRTISVKSLKVYDGVTLSEVTGSVSLKLLPGGTLYQSETGDSLYINPMVINIPSNIAAELAQRSKPFYTRHNVTTLQVFDGRQLFMFNGSAPFLINGGGAYYVNGDQVFFTSSPALQQAILIQSSLLNNYNTTLVNGRYFIITNGVSVFSFDAKAKLIPLQAGDIVSYSGGTVSSYINSSIPGLPIKASSLTLDTGFGTATYNLSTPLPHRGPGFLIVASSQVGGGAGAAFLSLSPSLTQRLVNAQTILLANYRPPVIATPKPILFASHYQNVTPPYRFPQFGQEIRVYEGADVFINATITDGNPTPSVTFSKLNGTNNWVDVSTVSNPDYIFGPTYLQINNVAPEDAGVYRVTATNAAGIATQQSVLRVNPAVPSSVGSAFLISKVQPGQQVIQVSNQTVQVVLNTVSQYLVNCKGMGRPRATISWFRNGSPLVNVANTVRVDPKQGTSYLNVSVSSTDTPSCVTYSCLAANIIHTSTGSVAVCTQKYTCNSTNNFTPCSVTCGLSGYKTEILDCYFFENVTSRVSIDYANIPTGYITNTPKVTLGCGQGDCPVTTYQYEVSDFGSCSATCGVGIQSRSFFCVQVVSKTGSTTNKTALLSTIQCQLAGKSVNSSVSLVRVCNIQPCPTWSVGSYGACSVTCGDGIQTRTVQCTNSSGAVFNESICLDVVKPISTIVCQQPLCPFAWTFSAWGPCTPDCIVGIQNRTVFCTDVRKPTVPVDNSFCTGVKPADTNRCGSSSCPGVGLWLTSAFSTCVPNNGSCGNGLQSRNVTCVDIKNLSVSSIYCNPDTKPSVSLNCFLVTCGSGCNSEPTYCPLVPKMFCPKFSTLCCISCPLVPSPTPTATTPTATTPPPTPTATTSP